MRISKTSKVILKALHYLIIFLVSAVVIGGIYGYSITAIEERKEMYLYGTSVFLLILIFYLGVAWALKRNYRKREQRD